MVSSARAARAARFHSRARLTCALLGSVALAFTLLGCDKRSDDVREWRATDHDRADGSQQAAPGQAQPQAPSPQGPMPSLAALGISDVTLAAWKQNCVLCHGIIGRGDGPQGPMMRPTDLTNPEWQKKTSDDQIRASILRGRGRMPAFSQLPPETVDGLIKFVRLLNSERPAEPEGAAPGAPSAAPAAPPGAPPAASPAAGQNTPNPAPTAPAPTAPAPTAPAPTAP